MSKGNLLRRIGQMAELPAVRLPDEIQLELLSEIRDLLKTQAEDMNWLRTKLERSNVLGR